MSARNRGCHVPALEDRPDRQRINELHVRDLGPTAATGIRRTTRGPSFAVAPTGEVLAEGTDPMILVTLDRNVLDEVRRRYPGYLPVRADLYAEGWKSVTSNRIAAPPA